MVPRKLSGQYYYLDGEYPKHFGHFMAEIIPRLYAWEDAKVQNPALKVLMSSPTEDGNLLPYQEHIAQCVLRHDAC